jgi:hypothetical protein
MAFSRRVTALQVNRFATVGALKNRLNIQSGWNQMRHPCALHPDIQEPISFILFNHAVLTGAIVRKLASEKRRPNVRLLSRGIHLRTTNNYNREIKP